MESEVNVYDVPKEPLLRKHFIDQQNQNIKVLAVRSRREERIPDESAPNNQDRFNKLRLYLDFLETDFEVSLKVKNDTKLDAVFKFIFGTPGIYFPEDITSRAQALFEKWEAEHWGRDLVPDLPDLVEDDEEVSTVPEPETPLSISSPINSSQRRQLPRELERETVRLPPRDHPIYGQNGIMHGVISIRKPSGRRSYLLNPTLLRKPAKIWGHNGLEIGQWFATRLVAIHCGAHGASQAGISGDTRLGAYSIVVSDSYEDLDTDNGETLYYSGSNSHNNDDPDHPAPSTTGTLALIASLRTHHPVRVLRSGGSAHGPQVRNRYAPPCGLRYDGLYTVTEHTLKRNKRGGLYERFTLVREPDQPSLEAIRQNCPTAQQIADLQEIQRGY